MKRELSLVLVLLAPALSGCEDSWLDRLWKRLTHEPGPAVETAVHPAALEVAGVVISDARVQAALDLVVRFGLVQDRDRPQYTIPDVLVLGQRTTCGELPPATMRAELSALGTETAVAGEYENPLMWTGQLAAALAVRQRRQERPEEQALLGGILDRMSALAHRTAEPGYLVRMDGQSRWRENTGPDPDFACFFPNGYCTTLAALPNASPPYADEQQWQNRPVRFWEPSQDEFTGVLLATSFVYHLVPDAGLRAKAKALMADVGGYLRRHAYLIERPCPDGGISWRGAHVVLDAYLWERVMESMGLGFFDPRFPTPTEYCARNRLAPLDDALLPCEAPMYSTYRTEMRWVLSAIQSPIAGCAHALFEIARAGLSLPFVTANGPGVELMAISMLALAPFDKDGTIAAEYQSWYRGVHANTPERTTPLDTAILAYFGGALRAEDTPLIAKMASREIFDGVALPPEGDAQIVYSVVWNLLLPAVLLGEAMNHPFVAPIAAEALPRGN